MTTVNALMLEDAALVALKEEVLEQAAYRAKQYAVTNEKFCKEIKANPFYALEWSDSFFTETAVAHVWARLAGYLSNDKCTVNAIVDELTRQVLDSYPNNSTSKPSNHIKDAEQYATRQVLKELTAAVARFNRKMGK